MWFTKPATPQTVAGSLLLEANSARSRIDSVDSDLRGSWQIAWTVFVHRSTPSLSRGS